MRAQPKDLGAYTKPPADAPYPAIADGRRRSPITNNLDNSVCSRMDMKLEIILAPVVAEA